MQSSVPTAAYRGIEMLDVSVQVHISNGLPAMVIVGLADKAVAESKERVWAALSMFSLALPAKRIDLNLSPADPLKEGAHFDLPIAMGLLLAMGVLPSDSSSELINYGRGNQLIAARVAQAESGLEDGLDLADLKGQETARRVVPKTICPANLPLLGKRTNQRY